MTENKFERGKEMYVMKNQVSLFVEFRYYIIRLVIDNIRYYDKTKIDKTYQLYLCFQWFVML